MPKLTYLGHSAFQIEFENSALTIDPFLSGNEQSAASPDDIKTDWVFLTHGHNDHFGDALDIARANNATIIAPNELAIYCESKGANVHPMHIGGSFKFPFGRVKLTIAHHGSAYVENDGTMVYTGNPCGVLIMAEGKTFYDAADTSLFYDMKLIGEHNSIDLAALPIGDNFTMGIDDAVLAAEFIRPKKVFPIHFNTFDLIKANPAEFVEKLARKGIDGFTMEPGQSIEY